MSDDRSAEPRDPPGGEPVTLRLDDELYRRVGGLWVDRRFMVVSTIVAARLDETVYLQALERGQAASGPVDPVRG